MQFLTNPDKDCPKKYQFNPICNYLIEFTLIFFILSYNNYPIIKICLAYVKKSKSKFIPKKISKHLETKKNIF